MFFTGAAAPPLSRGLKERSRGLEREKREREREGRERERRERERERERERREEKERWKNVQRARKKSVSSSHPFNRRTTPALLHLSSAEQSSSASSPRLGKEPERNSIEDNDAEKQRRTVAPLESRSTRHLFCRRAAAVSVADENVFFLNPSLKKKRFFDGGPRGLPAF